jgi:hypothetical protein
MKYKDLWVEYDNEKKVNWLMIKSRVEKKYVEADAWRHSIVLYDKYYPTEEGEEPIPNPYFPLIEIIENYLEETLRALISRVSREIFLAEVFLWKTPFE